MCKLAGWTASQNRPLNKPSADSAILAAHDVITRTENDGFGFAQPASPGLWGRYREPSDFEGMDAIHTLEKRAGKGFGAFRIASTAHQRGAYRRDRGMMIHGRTATCGISLTNTHPFRDRGWTLSHNGVISWNGEKTKDHTSATCDSQHLLIALADHAGDEEKQKEALQNISGYAAFLAFAPSGQMIVARDATASLYAGITSKGRWIFGTTAAIVDAIADAWECKNVTPHKLDDWTWLTFPSTGADPVVTEWKHKTATAHQMGFASRSLGSTWKPSLAKRKPSYYDDVAWGDDDGMSVPAYVPAGAPKMNGEPLAGGSAF
jgi:hypothetical protein